jgi:hypothetical protein
MRVKVGGMKIVTDDPDWKRDLYEARALAMRLVGRHGQTVQGGRQALRNGLMVIYDRGRSPMQFTIDAEGKRVLSIE